MERGKIRNKVNEFHFGCDKFEMPMGHPSRDVPQVIGKVELGHRTEMKTGYGDMGAICMNRGSK